MTEENNMLFAFSVHRHAKKKLEKKWNSKIKKCKNGLSSENSEIKVNNSEFQEVSVQKI